MYVYEICARMYVYYIRKRAYGLDGQDEISRLATHKYKYVWERGAPSKGYRDGRG